MKTNYGNINEKRREDWIASQLAAFPAGLKILDAGAGELKYKKFCAHLQYTSQDFSQYNGQGDGAGLQAAKWDVSKIDIVSDICDIPIGNESFDAILCAEVFEHIPDPMLAIKEFHRLLKGGGKLIITAPFCSLTHFSPFHYYSGFNKFFYTTHLEKAGFEILTLQTNGNYFEYLGQELQRLEEIAKEYSHCSFSFFQKKLIALLLSALAKLSRKDKGSSELLCFGHHVLAKKK